MIIYDTEGGGKIMVDNVTISRKTYEGLVRISRTYQQQLWYFRGEIDESDEPLDFRFNYPPDELERDLDEISGLISQAEEEASASP
jgi:hypothetical protein